MPYLISGGDFEIGFEKARKLAEAVGLGGRLEHYPSMLSGGEQQVYRCLKILPTGLAEFYSLQETKQASFKTPSLIRFTFFTGF